MSLRDDLDEIRMNQTRGYREEEPGNKPKSTSKETEAINKEILGGDKANDADENNPFKKRKEGSFTDGMDIKKILLFGGGAIAVIALVIVFYFVFTSSNEDKGAAFLDEMEEGEYTFQYTIDEREMLRLNGYTADDIERYEAEERDPVHLATEAEDARKRKYDEEIKPYLDGASAKYKELESMTWLGTPDMNPVILNTQPGEYEERYGTYNCNYTKIPAKGAQLFLKIDLVDFDEVIFMTVTPERYNELRDKGNIVVVIEYNKYEDESILVTNVYEKDIRG